MDGVEETVMEADNGTRMEMDNGMGIKGGTMEAGTTDMEVGIKDKRFKKRFSNSYDASCGTVI